MMILILWYFQHPSMAIVKGAGLVMKAIIEVDIHVEFQVLNFKFVQI